MTLHKGTEGKCRVCGAPLAGIVSCTMDGCPLPPKNQADMEKLIADLKKAANAQ